MNFAFIGQEADPYLDWNDLAAAIEAEHSRPRAKIGDTFLYQDPNTLLSRSALIEGLGIAVKSATVFPGNPADGKPMIGGAVSLFSAQDGHLEAILDFHLVTKWKTAADSLLAAKKLAPPDTSSILIVGAGTVGRNLVSAYRAGFPDAAISIWNRSQDKASAMADELGLTAVRDLADAVNAADVISMATMSTEPLLQGAWLRPGQHVDCIGAYRPDMREVDDGALLRSRVFVDSFDTTLDHIGELKIPLAAGTIDRSHVLADYYDIGAFSRQSPDDITLFKNGGGAHLDLMTSKYILDCWNAR